MSFSHVMGQKDGYTLVMLEGKLIDTAVAQQLQHEIEASVDDENINFIIDLARLEYLNSSGMNVLVNVLTKSRNAGGETILCNLAPSVQQLFIVTKLSSVFTIVNSVLEAESKINNLKSNENS